jgi:hypothetical protein
MTMTIGPISRVVRDCNTNPCDLCLERAKYAGEFVALSKEIRPSVMEHIGFVCSQCIPTHSPPIDLSLDEVELWDEGSDGWTGPIECMDCGESIPVEIGEECAACGGFDLNIPCPECKGTGRTMINADDEVTEKIPNMDALVRELHERGHSQ